MYSTENRVNTGHKILPDSIPYLNELRAAVIDIETSGLSGDRDMVYLIGILSEDDKGLKVTQLLASDKDDEVNILRAASEILKKYDILLNYNGTSFDLPFLNKRCGKLCPEISFDLCRSADYLKYFRTSYLPELLPDLRLKTVEKLAGVEREDQISGKDCIEMYKRFSQKGDREAGRLLLLHNYEDLSCFPMLNNLIRKIDMHNAAFRCGFPVRSSDRIFFVNSIKTGKGTVTAEGIIPGYYTALSYYEDSYTLTSVHGESGTEFRLRLQVQPEILTNMRLINNIIIETLEEIKI